MKIKGEKGKCVKCKHLSTGSFDIHAWCLYKNMRFICGIKIANGDEKLKKKVLTVKHRGELITKLENRVNPSWCPYRNGVVD